MTTIATFPAPSAALVTELTESGQLFDVAAAYCATEGFATLNDGTVVRMRRFFAAKMLRAISKGLPAMPVAVTKINFESLEALAEKTSKDSPTRTRMRPPSSLPPWRTETKREAADRLKWDRFYAFCAEDGHNGRTESVQFCRKCNSEQNGVSTWAPDGMGYPTEVLWTCGCCSTHA